jgi:predicted RNase H-like nuclease (RuvC/YqgF family)
MEALDMAFVNKFISKKHAPKIVESLAKMYDDAIIDDKSLKIDVGIILGGMILKHIENVKKQKRLLEMINMIQIQSDWEKLIYDEYGDELTKKDEELEAQSKKLNQQAQEIKNKNDELKSKDDVIKSQGDEINKLLKSNNEYKKKIKELGDLDDLDPKVKEVINYLMIL